MTDSLFIFEHSRWWIIAVLLTAGAISYITYSKKGYPWSKNVNKLLFLTRFIGLSIILFLLLNPLLNQLVNTIEKPKVVIAVDNSSSMLHANDSNEINSILLSVQEYIRDAGYDIDIITFDSIVKEENRISYNTQTSDINGMFDDIFDDYQGNNIGSIVLLSDGIYNKGMSPLYRNYLDPVFTIGFGDTIPPKDMSIVRVNANNVVYQGNIFPVEVLIDGKSYIDKEISVSLHSRGKELDRKNVKLSTGNIINFNVTAEESGLRRFTVNIPVMDDESSAQNNTYEFYVDIIEGKERVLIIAPAPHPDIRSIRSAISSSNNYETYLYIPGSSEFDNELEYDVVVYHHAFSPETPKILFKGNAASWYILDRSSNLESVQTTTGLKIEVSNNQRDNVTAAYNTKFGKFKLGNESENFNDYPTIEVPFGNYSLSGPTEVLLYQKVGSVPTDRPLISFFDDGNNRSALLVGSGIWKWGLQEQALNGSMDNYKNLVLKIIQYLSVQNNKRKFIFTPAKKDNLTGEQIYFTSETYDEIYERVGGTNILLEVKDEFNQISSFDFTSDVNNSSYSIGTLNEGLYSYNATTQVNNNTYATSGEFLVKKIHLEALNLTANHQILKEISKKSGGKYFHGSQSALLENEFSSLNLKSIIYTDQDIIPLIRVVWILIFTILLFSVEWFLRKFLGGY